jgi:hypothetical protein
MAHDGARQPRREAVGRGRTGLVIEPCVRVVPEELAGYQAGVPAPARPKDAAGGSPPSPPPPRARYAAAAGRLNYVPGRPV